jgi:hypothetical protein
MQSSRGRFQAYAALGMTRLTGPVPVDVLESSVLIRDGLSLKTNTLRETHCVPFEIFHSHPTASSIDYRRTDSSKIVTIASNRYYAESLCLGFKCRGGMKSYRRRRTGHRFTCPRPGNLPSRPLHKNTLEGQWSKRILPYQDKILTVPGSRFSVLLATTTPSSVVPLGTLSLIDNIIHL